MMYTVYQSKYINAPIQQRFTCIKENPPQNAFFHPPKKNKNEKKTRKKIHGGMRGCDESVATWAGKQTVGRWPFLSVGDSVSALCQKSLGLKFIPTPYRSETMFFCWSRKIARFSVQGATFSFRHHGFCGGYVTYTIRSTPKISCFFSCSEESAGTPQ